MEIIKTIGKKMEKIGKAVTEAGSILARDDNETELNDKFLLACKERKLDEVQSTLERGADINAKDAEGNTALIIASSVHDSHRPSDNDSFNLMCLLLRYGLEREGRKKIKVDEPDNKGNTALIKASRNGAVRIVQKLIDVHANVNAKNSKGYTALMRAEEHGYSETARILREHGAV